MRWQPTLAVGVGGIIGAAARWALVEALPEPSGWPWAVLAANVVGAGLLGWLFLSGPLTQLRLAASVGFCGSLTTFSTLTVAVADLAADDRWALASSYLVTSVTAGIAAFLIGRAVALR